VSSDYLDPIEQGSTAEAGTRPPQSNGSSKARWLFAAKLVVGLSLCAIIVARVDWGAAASSLASTGLTLIAVMFGILIAIVFLSAYKWRLLLLIHGVEYSTLRLSKYYFIALFFNNFLPTSIGGDGYRIYKTFDNGRSRASAVISVFMERLTGFGTLVALGVGAALILAAETHGELTMLMVGVVVGGLALPAIAWHMRSLVPRRVLDAMPEKLKRLQVTIIEHFEDYVRQPGRSAAVLVLSVVFHVSLAYAYFVILRYGTGQPISMLEVMAVLSLSTFVAVLPISINGIGVFEGTFIYLIAQYGVPAEASVVPMILNRGLLIALSLAGAVLYLLDTAGVAPTRPARVDAGN
jgi:uncharacterized protein (TIRG00374 family)